MVEIVKVKLDFKKVPQPTLLEAGSDDNLKDLLSQGIEDDVPRKWSCF